MVSDVGAPRQRLHADTTFDDRGMLLTVLIALNDVESDMGGFRVVPQTANRLGHTALSNMFTLGIGDHMRCERRLLSEQGLRFEGSAGGALLLDSRVLHCGGENHSAARIGNAGGCCT
jgi:ectoine hydroxylase-related dioxygenase (phytanoyl-CoA dioxygenase family)